MRRSLYAFFLCLIVAGRESISGLSDTTVQALDKLDKVIETKDDLEMQKESRIAIIKKELNGLDPNSPAYLTLRFDTYKRIYDEYIKFNADSAMRYALLKLDYVRDYNITERDMVWDAYHAVAERYLLSGMYEEAKTLIVELEKASGEHPSHLLHTLYNGLYVRSSNADLRAYYRSRALEERERLYQELPEDHIARWYINGDILLENEKPEEAYHFLIAKYEDPELDHEQKAIIAYLIGNAFSVMGKSDDAIRWYAESAFHDLILCSREYASLPALAAALYEKGNVSRAYNYISRSIDDAKSLNVLLNVQKINEILPVITNSYNKKITRISAILSSLVIVLVIVLVILLVAIVRSLSNAHKVRKIGKELHLSNSRLEAMNVELKANMEELKESNRLKQAYIGRYLDQCSYYIGRIEKYRSYLRNITKHGNIDEIRQALKSDEYINNELKDFYSQFDATFLDLFPDFVDRLNSLLRPEERIDVNIEDGILSTELRVFALIQLGITDSIKISEFLRRSVSTVYNYRVKLRNASILDRGSFEEELIKHNQ